DVCEPPGGWGGRAKNENSSRRHPRKLGQKRFLAVRRSWRGNGGACLWGTSLEKIFGGVIAIISFRPAGLVQQATLPRYAILSVGRHGAVRRREFITLLGGAAAWPVAARAQGERVRKIGVLVPATAGTPHWRAYVASFREGLQRLGWSDGRNIRIEERW